MTELSPEDISRAREWMAGNWPLLGGITFAPEEIVVLTIGCISEAVAAYSAAENERLTKERDALRDENYHLRHAPRGCSFCGELQGHKQTCWTVGTLLALEAAEAKCDRLKGALEDMLKMAKMLIRYTSEHPITYKESLKQCQDRLIQELERGVPQAEPPK